MKQFIIDNAQWIFSGIGVAVIAGAVRLFFGWKTKHKACAANHGSTQSITAGHASTNIQTGNGSTVLVSTSPPTRDATTQHIHPVKIDRNGAIMHKTRISEGDYQEFIWGATTIRISVSEIVKADFYFSWLMGKKEALGAVIDFSMGGGLVYGGADCKKTGVNQYLIPQKQFDDEQLCSVYAYHIGEDSFNFIRVLVDHINQHSRQVSLNLFFADIRYVKTSQQTTLPDRR